MTEARRFDYEVLPRPSGEQQTVTGRPNSVSRRASSTSTITVETPEGKVQLSFSTIPKDEKLEGTSDDARIGGYRILGMEAGHYLLKRLFRGKSAKPRQLEAGIVHPEPGESAKPELVVREQERVPIGDDLAFMGDGQRMTIDGENARANEFARNNPDLLTIIGAGPKTD